MKRNVVIIILCLLILIPTVGYLYLRHHVLKAKDYKPDNSKAKNVLDLRPSVIAKLQQLVKDGSNGLYRLSMDSIEPNVLTSQVTVFNASINIDSAAMKQLDGEKRLPDDIFKIKFNTLHIDGLGLDAFLHQKNIDLTDILINKPVIDLYHQQRSYNEAKREADASKTLYQRLMGNMNRIAIGKVDIKDGIFIEHFPSKEPPLKFHDLSVNLKDILIDSSTQFDNKRVFFAKHAALITRNYTFVTTDNLYAIKAGTISVSGENNSLIAENIHIKPNHDREGLARIMKYRKEVYTLDLPHLALEGINWRSLLTGEKLIAEKADIQNADIGVFFDMSLPINKSLTLKYPQQKLMALNFPLAVSKVQFKNARISRTEYNPKIKNTF